METRPLSLSEEIVTPLLYWYAENRRILPWREDPTPYHVWISEIMLQQTRVEAVKPYYTRFLEAFPTPAALAQAEPDRLMKMWEGLGYYSRARNLQKAAKVITSEYGGALPADLSLLRSLPGIGPYTAGAIASIAFGIPAPAVDGNVLRVISRFLGSEEDISLPATVKKITSLLAEIYPADPDGASSMTQALMELGATVCLPGGEPKCALCPLADLCRARAEGKTSSIPVKAPKKPRTVGQFTVLLLCCNGRYALSKRPEHGLLAGLWEFPNFPANLTEEEIRALPFGEHVLSVEPLPDAVHVFTHKEWHMTGFRCMLDTPVGPYLYLTKNEIGAEYAVASAFRAYKNEL